MTSPAIMRRLCIAPHVEGGSAMRMPKIRSGTRVCSPLGKKAAKDKGSSVGPIGAEASWCVSAFDCGVDVAAVEERQTPVEQAGVGSCQSIGDAGRLTGQKSIGIVDHKWEGCACPIRSLIGGGKSLRGSGAIPESEILASGKAGGGRVQKIDGVGAAIEKTRILKGFSVEDRGDVGIRRSNGVDGRASQAIVGLRADAEDERASDAGFGSSDCRQFDDHAIVIRCEKRHRILDLLGNGLGGDLAA